MPNAGTLIRSPIEPAQVPLVVSTIVNRASTPASQKAGVPATNVRTSGAVHSRGDVAQRRVSWSARWSSSASSSPGRSRRTVTTPSDISPTTGRVRGAAEAGSVASRENTTASARTRPSASAERS